MKVDTLHVFNYHTFTLRLASVVTTLLELTIMLLLFLSGN